MTFILIIITAIFLSYANGANDNFKGVASLFGSRTTSFRKALYWANATTFLGSLSALWIANRLLETFSGKGLVTDYLTDSPDFLISVGLGAAGTVFLASLLGFPFSTTHSLVGSLVGAALIADPAGVNLRALGLVFLVPLLLSPTVAVVLTSLLYPTLRFVRQRWGLTKESCICLGQEIVQMVPEGSHARIAATTTNLTLSVGQKVQCIERYQGSILGLNAQKALETGHFLSSGLVSFARGLNDTPKIAALLLVAGTVDPFIGFWLVGIAMACGGLLGSRKVALTMSRRITPMNHGQGFTGNFVTALLVIFASRWGLPVSTTHVSCGSLFGIGLVTGEGHGKTIRNILLSWVITLPVAALVAALLFWFQATA